MKVAISRLGSALLGAGKEMNRRPEAGINVVTGFITSFMENSRW